MIEIKDRLKEALNTRNMLPAELAKKTGISKGNISRYLHGTVIPKQSKIGEMARALNVSPAWLMGYDVDMKPQSFSTVPDLDTLPSGTFHGGLNIRADLWMEFSRLSDRNQEQAMTYIKYLAELQKKEEENNDEQS